MRRGLLAFLLPILVARESVAAPPPLDRIVAVVDQGVITLSELRNRARPHVRQVAEKTKPDKAAVDAIYAEVLQHLIDERLIAMDAEAHHLSATNEEIDAGIASITKSNNVTEAELFARVERLGMTRAEYREEIRRQLIDGRWMILVVGSTLKVPRSDEKAYSKALEEGRAKELTRLRAAHYIEVRK